MIDLKIVDDDISINNIGKLKTRKDHKLVVQKVIITLKLQQGLYFYDVEAGIPWIEIIKNIISVQTCPAIIISKMYAVTGVQKVYKIEPKINSNREMTITGALSDEYGQMIYLNESIPS